MSVHSDVEEAVSGASFVQVKAPKRLEIEQRTFSEMEVSLVPDIVTASSASGIMSSAVHAGVDNPARFLVGHPFNPPHLLPLVKVVGSQQTRPDSIARAMEFTEALASE